MGTPEQWVLAFVYTTVLGGLMYFFVVFPENKPKNSFSVVLWKTLGLIFGSFSAGIGREFGLHTIVHSALVWIFSAVLMAMILSAIFLHHVAAREKEAQLAAAPR